MFAGKTKIIFYILIILFVSCSRETITATPEKPFKGKSNFEVFENKGYVLSFRIPKELKKDKEYKSRIIYKIRGVEFVIMLILYDKNIPRWAYYTQRRTYQNYREKKRISFTYSGNRTLGGMKNTFYYLKEKRVNPKNSKSLYLTFFERYVDNIAGSNNALIKIVLRSEKKEQMDAFLNSAAFIFRTFKIRFIHKSVE